MKLTKTKLYQLIKEELQSTILESGPKSPGINVATERARKLLQSAWAHSQEAIQLVSTARETGAARGDPNFEIEHGRGITAAITATADAISKAEGIIMRLETVSTHGFVDPSKKKYQSAHLKTIPPGERQFTATRNPDDP